LTPEFLQTLRIRHELLNDPRFLDWVKETEAQLSDMQQSGILITKAAVAKSNTLAEMLTHLGLEPPETPEDSLRIYLALRCVLNFWRRKLGQLKTQSVLYEQEQKRLNAGTANSDLGRKPRIVAR
jgi:hypothetical protein